MSHLTARHLRWLPWTLGALGVVCLAWSGFVVVELWLYQRAQRSALEQTLAGRHAPIQDVGQTEPPSATRVGDPIGILEIPRLHLSAVVVNGDDDATLQVAIGHLPDTPLPWESGNSAFAAHRDTFFRPLEHIRVNDEVHVATLRGDFRYRVRRTMIVSPDDLSVLDSGLRPTLTLVTCYPFSYVGHAPQRMVVQAEMEEMPAN